MWRGTFPEENCEGYDTGKAYICMCGGNLGCFFSQGGELVGTDLTGSDWLGGAVS